MPILQKDVSWSHVVFSSGVEMKFPVQWRVQTNRLFDRRADSNCTHCAVQCLHRVPHPFYLHCSKPFIGGRHQWFWTQRYIIQPLMEQVNIVRLYYQPSAMCGDIYIGGVITNYPPRRHWWEDCEPDSAMARSLSQKLCTSLISTCQLKSPPKSFQ